MKELYHGIILFIVGIIMTVGGFYMVFFTNIDETLRMILWFIFSIGMLVTASGMKILNRIQSIGQWDNKLREALK